MMIRRLACAALSLVTLATPVIADISPERATRLGDANLHADSATVAMLDLSRGEGPSGEVALRLGGEDMVLVLAPHSIRAADYKVFLTDGRTVREHPAPPERVYRGHLIGEPDSVATAMFTDDGMSAMILRGDETWFVQPLSDVDPNGRRGEHVIYHSDDVIPGDWSCGADAATDHEPEIVMAATAPTGACLATAKIAIETDYEYFVNNDSDADATNADITRMMMSLDLIFSSQVGVGYELTATFIWTEDVDPYVATDIYDILSEFQTFWNATMGGIEYDVAHMLSGKEPTTGVVGLASVATVCRDGQNDLAYGVSLTNYTDNYALRLSLTAHELGHNWAALHCNQPSCPPDDPECTNCGIMCSGIASCGPALLFGPQSRAAIAAFRDTRPCLDIETGDVRVVFPPADRLVASDGDQFDFYGFSVGVAEPEDPLGDGHVVVVGAPFRDISYDKGKKDPLVLSDVGAAYVYRYSGDDRAWRNELILLPAADDPEAMMPHESGRFGAAVAADGDVIVVAQPAGEVDDDGVPVINAGLVYVYRDEGSGYALEQILESDDPDNSDNFGTSIDVSGNYIIVGEPFDGESGPGAGAAYVFRHDGIAWQSTGKIVPTEVMAGDSFGTSVAINDDPETDGIDWAAIGAPFHDIDGTITDAGAVFMYHRQVLDWAYDSRLTAMDAMESDEFGSDVAVYGEKVAVGAWLDDNYEGFAGDDIEDRGAVYVYQRFKGVSWIVTQKIRPPDGVPTGAEFGSSVDMTDENMLIGAFGSGTQGNGSGASWAYGLLGDPEVNSQWSLLGAIASVPGFTGNGFGVEVAIDGRTAAVGSWYAEGDAVGQGAAEAFFLSGDCDDNGVIDLCEFATDCNANGVPDSCDIANGTSTDKNGDGIPDECFVDCNGNGIDDTFDVDPFDPDGNGEVSADCNANGIPDECESQADCDNDGNPDICEVITQGDCNGNGIPDDCDIANGAPDCNFNGIIDTCETDVYLVSPVFSPIGTGAEANWNVGVVPVAASDTVTFVVTASADLDESGGALPEYINIRINGANIPELNFLFRVGSRECPLIQGLSHDVATAIIDAEDWNEAVESGWVTVRAEPVNVDPTECNVPGPPSELWIEVFYEGGDCNENGVPDTCDIAMGTSNDGDLNGIPDECECGGDLNGDGFVTVDDLLPLLAVWGPCGGCPEDLNFDGVVDVSDLLIVLADWGECD